MVGKLITLPLRVPLRSAQLLMRAAGEVAGRALAIKGQAIQVVTPRAIASTLGMTRRRHRAPRPAAS